MTKPNPVYTCRECGEELVIFGPEPGKAQCIWCGHVNDLGRVEQEATP